LNPDIFHAHLDACTQCREHPFDLCGAGAILLQQAAEGLPVRRTVGEICYEAADSKHPVTDTKVNTEMYVCANCGCETNTSMDKPCTACGSVKVVLLGLVEKLFGKNWRECFR
jgi:hypothetical protein